MIALDPGTKVEYMYGGKWLKGVVHGYQQHETPDGIIKAVMYLIDTGENERVDEIAYDVRSREISRQVTAHQKKHGSSPQEAVAEVLKKNDLPETKIEIERTRQPKQVQVSQNFVRPL